jgi:hypothetical protein
MAIAMLALASTTHATEVGFFNLVVERILLKSDTSQNVGHRGEVWVKVNSSIAAIGRSASNW